MKEVERILRVDHAGEYGAIHVYKAQLMFARIFYKDIAPKLEEMLSHEKQHFQTFNNILNKRNIQHCNALNFWALGGFLLGFLTGILGRNAIWVCTNSIETTVLHHLDWQLKFLQENDSEAYDAVLSIKLDEEQHQEYGNQHAQISFIYKPIFWVVRQSTNFAIWLSTKL
ncbi:2-polyprenyl-3-methyl-6-methoxy-1,4-benzoquinol hydroxylase, coq7 type [uncultured Gammaproteobacteria bacterium]|jgi:ubiquinone biosynthesis monooxygenase Coq7|nr:2-polyprenyl-3-methyl-6-methoxy-1,4-benzoquinol hydroxylase [uncultured Gammaproteobacteria bacterium]CAC9490513.1 2-polyprenyl-3-methyl-6-methoxy-1,4-benzoquinol hydroxylase [uncultured Gammaproteobacteria bacterium]CAC9626171.1 2-polyprenyl-3-methyl-6-methoxy-1,4-benzoquinol hydroxylase, coq7 type [uncultured Gammaproteobacteria bacterium]CAC9628079.1 2-polyprenyl-3-methyl-6-methoxy-1,4-benzoquinol hydroxylase, coq7 type [uncultured Gammaproteobacteria bacterium]CAC9629597.1 2-polyprenyl-3